MPRRKKQPEEATAQTEEKSISTPFLYFLVQGRWQNSLGGSSPLRSPIVDHLIRLLEEEEERIRREQARRRPREQSEEEAPATRIEWLNDALKDPSLDKDAQAIISEVLKEVSSPGQMLARTIGRATTTFPKKGEVFCVPWSWWMGAMKAALEALEGMRREQAVRIVKSTVSVYPTMLSLGTGVPDEVREINVQLNPTSPQQARASIKRMHLVKPKQRDFTLVVKLLNSPSLNRVVPQKMGEIFRAIGESMGVGGGRPEFGKFQVIKVQELEAKEGERLIAELEGAGP